MNYFLMAIIGYLTGCLQFAYIFGRVFKGIDIRSLGHGNSGASNAVQTMGWKLGVVVGILDILKAVAAIQISRALFPAETAADGPLVVFLVGAAVVMGHNYPFFMGFKGGKGTASTVGMLFSLDYRLGLSAMLLMLVITIATDYIVIGTMALLILILGYTLYMDLGPISLIIAIGLALQSFFKHLPNLKRIRKGEENGLRKTFKIE
jgi:glycerol-3-phosphate acyltransferase PlsY